MTELQKQQQTGTEYRHTSQIRHYDDPAHKAAITDKAL